MNAPFQLNEKTGTYTTKNRASSTDNHLQFSLVIPLPVEDSGLTNSIVRLNNIHIGKSKSHIARRTPLLIMNQDTRQWTVRYAMGNGGTVKGLNKNVLALDYDAICDLGVRFGQPSNISIHKASLMESMRWLMSSPDLNVRLNTRFALLGVALGLVSLLITLITIL